MFKQLLPAGKFLILSVLALSALGNSMAYAKDSKSYDDLVRFFQEWRAFQAPEKIDGVPQYTAQAIQKQKDGLPEFRQRLNSFDISEWNTSEKVDYYLMQAEMNGMEFYHRVMKPWSRDPVFYLPSQASAGPVIDFDLFSILQELEPPLSQKDKAAIKQTLQAVPKIYQQAQKNLTEAAGDLADLAIHSVDQEAEGIYGMMIDMFSEMAPDLVADAEKAKQAVLDYGEWLKANRASMTAPAGIGKENYDWWLQKVQLFPYTWEKSKVIVDHEYGRVVSFLKLEEHKNRKLPPQKETRSAKRYYENLVGSINETINFLDKEDITTVPDWVKPEIYVSGPEDYAGDVTDPSLDGYVRRRDPLIGEAGHEFTGHAIDGMEHAMNEHPIRGANRVYWMTWLRTEGWAVALEEMLMQMGVIDDHSPRSREVTYLMNASHVSLAMPDLMMHSNQMNLEQGTRLIGKIMPNALSVHEGSIWENGDVFEMQSNLRIPGFHTGVLTGKSYILSMMREQAMTLGDKFVLKDFTDQFRSSSIVPLSLIRMEMTGDDSEVKALLAD